MKVKNDEKRLTFMVISQERGQFSFKDLPAGTYRVQGVGNGMQSEWFPDVKVASGVDAKAGVSLNVKQGTALPPAWPQRIPEADVLKASKDAKDLPAGDGKELVAEKCTSCHNVLRIVVKRSNEDDWSHTVQRMRTRMAIALQPDLSQDREQQDRQVSRRSLRRASAVRRQQPSAAHGDDRQGAALSRGDLQPREHARGAARRGGRSEGQSLGFRTRRQARQARHGDARRSREYDTPPGPASKDRQSLGNPQIDSKGILWVADGPNNRWLSYDTNNGKFLAFAFPRGKGNAGGNSLALHPDGTVWGTGGNKEARQLFPEKAEFKFYESPNAHGKELPGAYGLTVAGDGSVWYAEDEADNMIRIDPATGKVNSYKIPYQGHAFPRRMNADANGDVWVALWNAGKLMKVDHKTRQMTIYSPPTQTGGHYSVVVDKKNGYIWVSEHQVDKIARFDPKTQEWVEFPLPEAESDPRRLDIDPTNPNRIFFSGNTPGRMGFVEVLDN